MVFIKGGLNVIISATVILLSGSAKLNFCTSNPALHKYQNRYRQPYGDLLTLNLTARN